MRERETERGKKEMREKDKKERGEKERKRKTREKENEKNERRKKEKIKERGERENEREERMRERKKQEGDREREKRNPSLINSSSRKSSKFAQDLFWCQKPRRQKSRSFFEFLQSRFQRLEKKKKKELSYSIVPSLFFRFVRFLSFFLSFPSSIAF